MVRGGLHVDLPLGYTPNMESHRLPAGLSFWEQFNLPDPDCRLRVRLTPKGGQDALVKWEADTLYVRVAAPPVGGAANRALVGLLSKTLRIAKSRVAILSGEASRDKTIQFEAISDSDLKARINDALRGS